MVAAILLISILMFGICLYLANECHPKNTPKSERYSVAFLMAVTILVDISVLNHQDMPRLTLLLTFLGMLSILIVLINQVRNEE